jgi:hypothetical protein
MEKKIYRDRRSHRGDTVNSIKFSRATRGRLIQHPNIEFLAEQIGMGKHKKKKKNCPKKNSEKKQLDIP